MRLVIVTNADDSFGGVFARSYYAANGPVPVAVVVLPERPDLRAPPGPGSQLRTAIRLMGVGGMLRFAFARYARLAFPGDARTGLKERWLDSIRRGAPLVSVSEPNSPEGIAAIHALAPDLLVSIGAPRILSAKVLGLARIGALNVHNGRLPAYRGHFGTFWEVMNREPVAYSTVHVMAPRVDTGPIVDQRGVNVAECSGFLDLMLRKKSLAGQMLAEAIRRTIATNVIPIAEGTLTGEPGYYSWPTPEEISRFRWPRGIKPASTN